MSYPAWTDDVYSVKAWGAIGDNTSRPLSSVSIMGDTPTSGWTLAQWQTIFPHATALTDELDWCAIQGALNARSTAGFGGVTGGLCVVPTGQYRTGLHSVIVRSQTSLEGLAPVFGVSTHPCAIIADNAMVAPVVILNGGSGARGTGIRNIGITRAGSMPPAGSIGLQVTSADCPKVFNVYVWNHAIGLDQNNSATNNTYDNLHTGRCTDTHIQLRNGPQTTFMNCQLGRNGGLDYVCNSYIRIDTSEGGGIDTLSMIRTQCNQSGNLVGYLFDFVGYANGNGLFYFAGGHVEVLSQGVIRSDAATNYIRHFSICGSSSITSSVTTRPFFALNDATVLQDFNIEGGTIAIAMNWPANVGSRMRATGVSFAYNQTFTGGALKLVGCDFLSTVTVSGTVVDFQMIGCSFYGAGQTLVNTIDTSTSGSWDVRGCRSEGGTLIPDASSGSLAIGGYASVSGAGQNLPTFNTDSLLGGSLVLKDTGGSANNGGALVLAAGQGKFAAIKGRLTDGSNNTAGSIDFQTRRSSADTTLTSALTIANTGAVTAKAAFSAMGAIAGLTTVATGGYTVAGLPTASLALKGARAYVTDATSPTFLGTLTGGGSVIVPVFCNGTAWVAG